MDTPFKDMTRRDWFAGMALPTLLQQSGLSVSEVALACYNVADALVDEAERSEKLEQEMADEKDHLAAENKESV